MKAKGSDSKAVPGMYTYKRPVAKKHTDKGPKIQGQNSMVYSVDLKTLPEIKRGRSNSNSMLRIRSKSNMATSVRDGSYTNVQCEFKLDRSNSLPRIPTTPSVLPKIQYRRHSTASNLQSTSLLALAAVKWRSKGKLSLKQKRKSVSKMAQPIDEPEIVQTEPVIVESILNCGFSNDFESTLNSLRMCTLDW